MTAWQTLDLNPPNTYYNHVEPAITGLEDCLQSVIDYVRGLEASEVSAERSVSGARPGFLFACRDSKSRSK